MNDDTRWLVEVPNQGAHDVGAKSIEVTPGGALVFRDVAGQLLLAYAPDAWITVTGERA